MVKHKSRDYKISAVEYYLNNKINAGYNMRVVMTIYLVFPIHQKQMQ